MLSHFLHQDFSFVGTGPCQDNDGSSYSNKVSFDFNEDDPVQCMSTCASVDESIIHGLVGFKFFSPYRACTCLFTPHVIDSFIPDEGNCPSNADWCMVGSFGEGRISGSRDCESITGSWCDEVSCYRYDNFEVSLIGCQATRSINTTPECENLI